MKRRDLMLRRYWRREEDGTYVILCHSAVHQKCPPQSGYVRAFVKSGGFVITPMKQGNECVVKHMLSIDWRSFKSYILMASARSLTIRVLGRVAALREYYSAKTGNPSHEFSSGELMIDIAGKNSETVVKMMENKTEDGSSDKHTSGDSKLTGLDDADDEFFDVPDYDLLENGFSSDTTSESCCVINQV